MATHRRPPPPPPPLRLPDPRALAWRVWAALLELLKAVCPPDDDALEAGRDAEGCGRDAEHSDRDAEGCGRDAELSGRDAEGCGRDAEVSGRELEGSRPVGGRFPEEAFSPV